MKFNLFCIKAACGNFLLILLITLMVPTASAAFKYLQEGMPAPAVEGTDIISNQPVSTNELGKDNLLIVVFWSTWSKRSLEELSGLKEIALKYSDDPVKFVAVNVESDKLSPFQIESIKNKVIELDLPYPVIIDEGLKIFYQYGVIAVPTTAIIDTSGILRFGPGGYSLTTRDLIEDSIEVLLGRRQVTDKSTVRAGYLPNKKSSRYYNLALQLNGRGMYERALSNLAMAEKEDSNFSAPHNLHGDIYLKLDSIDAAIAQYRIAVGLDTNSVAARSGLGSAHLANDQIDSALYHLSATLAMDNSYTPAMLDLSLCLARQDKTGAALDSLNRAKELNFRDPRIHYYLGNVFLKTNDTTSALEAYKTALQFKFPAP